MFVLKVTKSHIRFRLSCITENIAIFLRLHQMRCIERILHRTISKYGILGRPESMAHGFLLLVVSQGMDDGDFIIRCVVLCIGLVFCCVDRVVIENGQRLYQGWG